MAAPAIVCTSCLVQFDDSALLRTHYKCDWHLYNAKRKLSSLPPVARDLFEAKMQALQATESSGTKKKGKDHLLDKTKDPKASADARSASDDPEAGDTAEADVAIRVPEEPWEPGMSLFDRSRFATFEESLEYMSKHYSFYIPDPEYCVDKIGLVRSLAALIQEPPHVCIFCSASLKSASGCRKHMLNKGHTLIGSTNDDVLCEMEPFYDYRSSIQELNLKATGRAKVQEVLDRDAEQDKVVAADEQNDTEAQDDDSEDVNIVECANEAEFKKVMEELGLQQAEFMPSGDLQLPDGSIATHRQWAYIYRQRNLHLSGRRVHGSQMLALRDAQDSRQNKAAHAQPIGKFVSKEEKKHRRYMIAVMKAENRVALKVADMAPLMYRRRADKRLLVQG